MIGFALGVLLTLAVNMRNAPDAVYVVESAPDGLGLTATRIIRDATAAAAAPPSQPTQNPPLDPVQATATAIVSGATQTAQEGG